MDAFEESRHLRTDPYLGVERAQTESLIAFLMRGVLRVGRNTSEMGIWISQMRAEARLAHSTTEAQLSPRVVIIDVAIAWLGMYYDLEF